MWTDLLQMSRTASLSVFRQTAFLFSLRILYVIPSGFLTRMARNCRTYGSVTVKAMERTLGTNPKDLLAVIQAFDLYGIKYVGRRNRTIFFCRFLRKRKMENICWICWGANRSRSYKARIPEENIEMPNLCTPDAIPIFCFHIVLRADSATTWAPFKYPV